jgi:hypothetical protein
MEQNNVTLSITCRRSRSLRPAVTEPVEAPATTGSGYTAKLAKDAKPSCLFCVLCVVSACLESFAHYSV